MPCDRNGVNKPANGARSSFVTLLHDIINISCCIKSDLDHREQYRRYISRAIFSLCYIPDVTSILQTCIIFIHHHRHIYTYAQVNYDEDQLI